MSVLQLAVLIGSTLQLSVATILVAALSVFYHTILPQFTGDHQLAHVVYCVLLGYACLNVVGGALGIIVCMRSSAQEDSDMKDDSALPKVLAEGVTAVYVLLYLLLYAMYLWASFDDTPTAILLQVLPLVPWLVVHTLWLWTCCAFSAQRDKASDEYVALPGSFADGFTDVLASPPAAPAPSARSALKEAMQAAPQAPAHATVWFPSLAASTSLAQAPPTLEPLAGSTRSDPTSDGQHHGLTEQLRTSSDQLLLRGSSWESTTSAVSMLGLMVHPNGHVGPRLGPATSAPAPVLSSPSKSSKATGSPSSAGLVVVGEEALEPQEHSLSGDISEQRPPPQRASVGTYLMEQVLSVTGLGSRNSQPAPAANSNRAPDFSVPLPASGNSTPHNFSLDGSAAEPSLSSALTATPVQSKGTNPPASSPDPHEPTPALPAPTHDTPPAKDKASVFGRLYSNLPGMPRWGAQAPADERQLESPATDVSSTPLLHKGVYDDEQPSPLPSSPPALRQYVPAGAAHSPAFDPFRSQPQPGAAGAAAAPQGKRGSSGGSNLADVAQARGSTQGGVWAGDSAALAVHNSMQDWHSSQASEDSFDIRESYVKVHSGDGDAAPLGLPPSRTASGTAEEANGESLPAPAPKLTSSLLGVFNLMWRPAQPAPAAESDTEAPFVDARVLADDAETVRSFQTAPDFDKSDHASVA